MFASAPLPSSEIAALDEVPITFTINIGLYVTNENRRKLISEDLESLFGSNEIFSAHVTKINVEASKVVDIKTPVKLEQTIMKQHEVKPGNLLVIEWKNLQDDILVSSDRTIFISEKVCEFFNLLKCLFLKNFCPSNSVRETLSSHQNVDGARSQDSLNPRSCHDF